MTEIYDVQLLEYLLHYFINGDVGDLTEKEIKVVDDFISSFKTADVERIVVVPEAEHNTSFGRCDVTKLLGTIVFVEVVCILKD